MATKLKRSNQDRIIGGVAGGLSEYFDFPVFIIRLLFVILAFTASGILIYLILWLVMPQSFGNKSYSNNFNNMKQQDYKSENGSGNLIAGVILISLGVIFLIDKYFPHIFFRDLWPFVLIIVGIVLIIGRKR